MLLDDGSKFELVDKFCYLGDMCRSRAEKNMGELCQERHEYKGGNGAGPLCLKEY